MPPTLFGEIQPAPQGFRYVPDFITRDEEAALIREMEQLPLAPYQHGEYEARRRIINFGGSSPPFPPWLKDMSTRAETLFGLGADSLTTAHLIEYSPGAPIGWHRDGSEYQDVVGISLGGSARFMLRKKITEEKHIGWKRYEIAVEPRSVYLMSGESRSDWQHSIPPVEHLRYSLTFRSMR